MYKIKIYDQNGRQINEFELSDFAIIGPNGKGMTSNGQDIMSFLMNQQEMAGDLGENDYSREEDREKENRRQAKIFEIKRRISKIGLDENGLPNH